MGCERGEQFEDLRVQEFKSSRVQEFKSSRVQEFKSVAPLRGVFFFGRGTPGLRPGSGVFCAYGAGEWSGFRRGGTG